MFSVRAYTLLASRKERRRLAYKELLRAPVIPKVCLEDPDQSFFGGVAILHVLPVLWMTSCLHIMARNRQHRKGVCTQSDSMGQHEFDIVACTQTDPPGEALDRGRSLISTIALLYASMCVAFSAFTLLVGRQEEHPVCK